MFSIALPDPSNAVPMVFPPSSTIFAVPSYTVPIFTFFSSITVDTPVNDFPTTSPSLFTISPAALSDNPSFCHLYLLLHQSRIDTDNFLPLVSTTSPVPARE